MFRSDSLAHAAPDDVVHLVEERGVRTVVDLRGAAEVDAFPNQPMADAGVTIHHVPLIDPEKREQSGLDWETMSLFDLYRFLLESAGTEFVEVLQIIAEPANHPLVFHCAAGKDRAGLIAATVLGLLEVDDEEIVADYAATEAALEALKDRVRRSGPTDTGRPPAARFMTADAATMRETLAWLHAEHGGFAPYLLGHGLSEGELALLRASLIEEVREMLIDGMLGGFDDVRATAAAGEAAGYAGLWTGETMHDPFLQIVQAAEVTERVTLGTSIAIAFGRTPMTLATTSYDLARYTRGRFVLGLGSQVKPHIERRFSMPWSHPAPRMREFVNALRAIWACWQDGTKLDFRGDFYTHTLMTPFFSPPAHEWGPPPVYLAGVGPLMTEVAGEVCDGFFFHGFTTPSYLREVTLPALARGRAAGGHSGLGEEAIDGFDIAGPAFTCVADTEEGLAGGDPRRQAADRVLRVDARVPRRARPPRVG